ERKSQVLGNRIVSGFYECIGGVIGGVVDVAGEVREVIDVGKETDPRQQPNLGELVPGVDAERHLRSTQRIEDRAVRKGNAGAGIACNFGTENFLIVAV